MPERRYTDDEVKRILSNAVEADAALGSGTAEPGMTLAEIERIGVEAGLAPATVRAAATSLDQVAPVPTEVRAFGLRVGVGQSVTLARSLSETEWRRLVLFLRETFQAQGREQGAPGHYEWRNGNLRITIESVGEGAVLQMRTRKANARSLISTGLALFAGGAVVEGAGQLVHVGPHMLGNALVLLLSGAAMAGLGAVQLPGWSAARQAQFQEIADYTRRLSAAPTGE